MTTRAKPARPPPVFDARVARWHEQGPLVRTLMTLETDGERIARVRNYFFTPDVIAEVCTELGVPYALNGYRYWR